MIGPTLLEPTMVSDALDLQLGTDDYAGRRDRLAARDGAVVGDDLPMPASARRSRRIAERALLVVGGVVLALGLLELGLRAAGWMYVLAQSARNAAGTSEDALRVLCIGESTTAFGGDDSYPSQLARALNAAGEGPHVHVVNKGLPATDTEDILERLPGWLDEIAPHVVVAMMGINDIANAAEGRRRSPFVVVRAVTELVARMRGARALDARPTAGNESATDAEARARIARLRDPADPAFDAAAAATEAGTIALAHGWLDEAADLFAAALAHRADDPVGQLGLALARSGPSAGPRRDAAIEQAIRAWPGDRAHHASAARLYAELIGGPLAPATRLRLLAHPSGDGGLWLFDEAYEWVAFAALKDGRHADAAGIALAKLALPIRRDPRAVAARRAQTALLLGRRDEFGSYLARANALRTADDYPPTRDNWRELRETLRARGIPLVAVQYPLRPVRVLREILGHDPSVVYVDNERTFADAIVRDGYDAYFTDVFAGDFGHATPRGNRMLAEAVAAAIREAGLARVQPDTGERIR